VEHCRDRALVVTTASQAVRQRRVVLGAGETGDRRARLEQARAELLPLRAVSVTAPERVSWAMKSPPRHTCSAPATEIAWSTWSR
jgi:hypothetical protein